jgi:hypothetical protein
MINERRPPWLKAISVTPRDCSKPTFGGDGATCSLRRRSSERSPHIQHGVFCHKAMLRTRCPTRSRLSSRSLLGTTEYHVDRQARNQIHYDPYICRAAGQHMVRISLPKHMSGPAFWFAKERSDICLEGRSLARPEMRARRRDSAKVASILQSERTFGFQIAKDHPQ